MPTARFIEVFLPLKLVYNESRFADPASPDVRRWAATNRQSRRLDAQ